LKGYAGCWVDGSISNIEFIKRELGGLEFDRLLVENRFVSVENIAEIVKRSCLWLGTTEPAFFSLDIDGNDLHVMKVALRYFKPAVVCAEYNSKFPPPLSITMPYAADFGWAGDDYHGASLQAFCDMLEEYKLVACNLTGANAFFVRREWATVFPNFTPKQLFQPFRESLIDLRSEHAPSMKWLRDKLRNQGSGDGKPALDVGTEQGGENNSGHNSTVSDS
jgi:hypothetical protein